MSELSPPLANNNPVISRQGRPRSALMRYITCGKIGLLCLVSLYVEHKLPNQSVVPILTFVVKHVAGGSNCSAGADTSLLTADDLREATINEPSTITGRTVYDLLLKKLWEINCFDALSMFFQDINDYVLEGNKAHVRAPGEMNVLKPSSVLGCFVRRAYVEFIRLSFHETQAIWEAFIQYREPTRAVCKKRNPNFPATNGFDVMLQDLPGDHPLVQKLYGRIGEVEEGVVSTYDIERLLDIQLDIMQSNQERAPKELRDRIRKMLSTNSNSPAILYYVEFLDSWRSGNYPGAFDSLHQYFDYSMQNRDKSFYQYALLNLGILQADFGCYREAFLAMEEAINIARENRDLQCLTFALSWIYHFSRTFPIDSAESAAIRVQRDNLLPHLRTKSKEGNMQHLQSIAFLAEAREALFGGEAISASLEAMLRSSYINGKRHILNAVGSQMIAQSVIWSRLGMPYLAHLNTEIFLSKHREGAPLEDYIKATCRTSLIMAVRGRVKDAFDRLRPFDSIASRSLKDFRFMKIFMGVMSLQSEIYRGNYSQAELILEQLGSCQPMEPEAEFEIELCRIKLQSRLGNDSKALELIAKVESKFNPDTADMFNRVKLMIAKAQVLKKCGRGVKALTIAVRAAAIAWRSRQMLMLYETLRALCEVLNDYGENQAAYNLLDGLMPQVIECEDAAMTADCLSTMVDAQVGMAGKDKIRRNEHLNKALELMDRAYAEYGKIEDVQSQAILTSKKARVHNHLGNLILRNEAASTCLRLRGQS